MKNIIHYALVLFIVAGLAGVGLNRVSEATKDRIAQSKKAALADGQKIAFPGAEKFSDEKPFNVNGEEAVYYEAYDSSGKLIGYVLRYGVMGYQSEVEVLTGVTPTGNIKAIKVLSQAETPGLGAEVDTLPSSGTIWKKVGSLFSGEKEKKKSGPPPIPAFQAQYSNKTISDLKVVKEKTDKYIEAISGATITSRAVTKAVRDPAEAFVKEVLKLEIRN